MSDMKKYLAELLGTFVLVFIGTGSAVVAGKEIGYLGIALAFGLSVLVMVYAIGQISGCHINPAITIAMLLNGKLPTKDAIMYVIFQCIGAIIASALLLTIMTGLPGYEVAPANLGANGYGADYLGGYSLTSAFIAEVITTFVFLMVIFGATSKKAPARFCRDCNRALTRYDSYGNYPYNRDFGQSSTEPWTCRSCRRYRTITALAVYRCTHHWGSNCSSCVEISV